MPVLPFALTTMFFLSSNLPRVSVCSVCTGYDEKSDSLLVGASFAAGLPEVDKGVCPSSVCSVRVSSVWLCVFAAAWLSG
uniref:Putative secreted protein n=1 Tax=Anopheles triannulatus TaxID=58253 RepID=A0A2M4B4P3_9DIPT